MRTFKLIGAAFAVLAITAFAATTASAEIVLWKWLPGAVGEFFKGSSGKTRLQIKAGGSIECKAATIGAKKGELLLLGSAGGKDATLALAVFVFSGCKALGLAARGLGDEKEKITTHVEIHNCLIKNGDFGLSILVLPLHIEIEETGLLFNITEGFIALIEPEGAPPTKNWNLNIKQKEGVQEPADCEGGQLEGLETSTDGGANMESGVQAASAKIEFENAAQEAMT